jgi:phenol/toluene 2-monooxygenase (NADH) P0/A0
MAQATEATPKHDTGGLPPARVRVTGLRRDAYAEFAFTLGDDTLTVELILPFAAFAEFRAARQARVLPPEPEVGAAIERLAWRLHRPELFRQLGYEPAHRPQTHATTRD